MATKSPQEDKRLRIVLLGKTGAGKSTLGNQLIEPAQEKFTVGSGLRSETKKSNWKTTTTCDGWQIQVVDTPGLCDTHLDESLIYKEVGKSVALAEPGPHVFLLTLRCDHRFTKEEHQAYKTIKQMFSDEMNKFTILVFNGLDTYSKQRERAWGDGKPQPTIDWDSPDSKDAMPLAEDLRDSLKRDIETSGPDLKHLKSAIEEANGRYIGMNNMASDSDRARQTNDLIKMIKELKLENGGSYYTTPVTTEINEGMDQLLSDVAKERRIPKSQAEEEVKRDIVEERVSSGFLTFLKGIVEKSVARIKEACRIS